MKQHTYLKPLALALLLGVSTLTLSSAFAVKGATEAKENSGLKDADRVGPQGTQGTQGIQGIQGIPGMPGSKGDTGAGSAGAAGAAGPQGIAGDVGAAGAVGAAGTQGIAGAVGAAGAQGIAGAVGAAGEAGSAGAAGAIGEAGPASAPVHVVGEQYKGGIIFWVDVDGQHGLIAALADQGTPIDWANGIEKRTGARGAGIGAGAMNTALIVAAQINDTLEAYCQPTPFCRSGGNFAAYMAVKYSIQDNGTDFCHANDNAGETCYADWYLPSNFELQKLAYARDCSGATGCDPIYGTFNTINPFYSSSTEFSESQYSAVSVEDGTLQLPTKTSLHQDGKRSVRSIRAF